jgi:hypothetical protein
MSRINKSTVGGKLANDLIRGFGLQIGRSAGKQLESTIKKRTLDTNSKFRKNISKFQLTGDFKKDVKKMISLIDQFDEEYTTTKAQFQKSWYLSDDVYFIEKKLCFMKDMMIAEEEQDLQRLLRLWNTYKAKHV